MDENEVKDKIVRQIVEGDRFQVELARDKVTILRDIGALAEPIDDNLHVQGPL